MGLKGQPQPQNNPDNVRTPIQVKQKLGRNEKILIKGPDGIQIKVKYKKLQSYLNKGYTQVS